MRALLEDAENVPVLSVASSWEMQFKIGLDKLRLARPLREAILREIRGIGLEVLPIGIHHTWRLSELPPLHRDPFDRLLVAQALEESLPFLSGDPLITPYPGVERIWD